MKGIKNILFLLLLAVLSIDGNSQAINNDEVPVDPEIRYGKLENGMTYYIRHNEEPEQRASFYMIQNVGALLENDDQNGLAHFLEHMAFNGTKNFPGKGIINGLEKHGVAFGYNINAYTAYNETVYNLSDVPVEKEGLLDTCLLVLHDWSNYLLLTEEEIDAERGVISEEWRTRRDANFRMTKEYMPVLLYGSKFPERDIIGDLELIQSFDYATLRNFYHDWYRTDLQALAIVGDFDAEAMERKVIELFSAIPAVKNPKVRSFFEVPQHDETLYVLATDEEASFYSVDLYIKQKATNPEDKGMSFLREQYVRTLFNSMMSTRISELLQKGVPPFVSGSVRFSGFVRGYNVYSIGATAKENEEALAFEAIYTEAERVKKHGFTPGELQRAKSNMLTNWENYYNEKDKIDNDSYAGAIQQHFLINEPLASIEFEYEIVKKLVPEISLGEISVKAKEWMTAENRVITVTGPEGDEINHLGREEALKIISRIEASEIDPYEDQVIGESLISEALAGSKITKTTDLPQFDAVEWILSNGAKVVFRMADYEKDNVLLSAFSPGGSSLVKDEYIPDITMMSTFIDAYGVSDFSNITLQKMLTGKKASVIASIGELSESFSGSSTPKDFETMMQLLYLKFEKPRFDREAHEALMSRYIGFMASMDNNPQKIMSDSIALITTNYHPRTRVMNTDFLNDVEFDQIENLYRERISDADDFTFFIVGNIEIETVKPMVEKYIGSLSSADGNENWVDTKVRAPEGRVVKEIEITLAVPKSTVFLNFVTELEYTPYNNQTLKVIKGILDLVYTETIREDEGGTYGVATGISLQQYPVSKARTVINFDCDPEKANHLKSIVYDEIKKLYTDGPDQEDLSKAVNNILKNREESKQHNSYWLSAIYNYYYRGINYDDPANYEDILNSLTIDDIKEAALSLFKDADVVDLIFKPKSEE